MERHIALLSLSRPEPWASSTQEHWPPLSGEVVLCRGGISPLWGTLLLPLSETFVSLAPPPHPHQFLQEVSASCPHCMLRHSFHVLDQEVSPASSSRGVPSNRSLMQAVLLAPPIPAPVPPCSFLTLNHSQNWLAEPMAFSTLPGHVQPLLPAGTLLPSFSFLQFPVLAVRVHPDTSMLCWVVPPR